MKNVVNITIYGLFFSIYFLDGFLGDGLFGRGLHLIPSKVSWICELISVVITFYVLLLFAIKKKMAIPNSYLLLFAIFTIFVFAGIVLNSVPPGAIFAGMRRYLLFIPLFFLPAVDYERLLDFRPKQLFANSKSIFKLAKLMCGAPLFG